MLGTGEVPKILEAIGDSRTRGPWTRDPAEPATLRCAAARSTRRLRAGLGPRTTDHGPRARDRAQLARLLYDADTPRLLTTPKHFAYVKIAEGCDYTCAFCIIPTLRGEYRSRDASTRSCARRGRSRSAASSELLLISQDTTLLRHRPRRARRAGAAAARAERGRRPRAGSGCSTSTRRRSPTTCSTRWRSARRSAATSTCRCSTRRPPC